MVRRDSANGGQATAIHPRLLPAAAARLNSLRSQLRAAYEDGATRLERALGHVQALAEQHESPETDKLLDEFERALEEMRLFAVLEAMDVDGILALRRRLETICEDLDSLAGERFRSVA